MNNSLSESARQQVKLLTRFRAATGKRCMRGTRMKCLMAVTIYSGALLMTILSPAGAKSQSGSTTKKSFGKTPDGQPADLFVLTNKNGAEVSITNYGGAGGALKGSARSGQIADRGLACQGTGRRCEGK